MIKLIDKATSEKDLAKITEQHEKYLKVVRKESAAK
jgi:hypothetical protein